MRAVIRGMLGAAAVVVGLALVVVSIDEGHVEWRRVALLLDADPPLPRHRTVLAGIRLAEIYRTHQHDVAKAEQVITRLVARYPDAPELAYVRPR